MTPKPIRDAVQTLLAQGRSVRDISRALKLSRNTVRRILREPADKEPALPPGMTPSTLQAAFTRAQGNVVRMQQLLLAEQECPLPYSTLTRWVRAANLRQPPVRAGEYTFGPGEEMQHDTSPHRVRLGDRLVTLQCASLILAYSRRLFFQYYPCFTRFEAKLFLRDATLFMAGCCASCIIDNTSVVLAGGSGPEALIAPEMAAFAQALGFSFRAHHVGHADRKGRIERPFAWIETNFLPARNFTDYTALNAQALTWCREVANCKPKRALGMSPDAAYAIEQAYLQPLPAVLPPVYAVSERVVDLYGYVSLETNRYSVPERLVGQTVTVYKHPSEVQIHAQGRLVATHPRLIGQRDGRHLDPAHHPTPVRVRQAPDRLTLSFLDDTTLRDYVAVLRQRGGARAVRRLLELQRTYPPQPFLSAIRQAAHFGLYDLGRLEKLILHYVAGEFFHLGDDDA
jgi:transposase-like protein